MKSKGLYSPIVNISEKDSYLVPNEDIRGIGSPYALKAGYFEASKLVDPTVIKGSGLTMIQIPSPIKDKYIQLPGGTVTSPGLAFVATADNDTGLYLKGANNPAMSVNGTLVFDWNTTRLLIASGYQLQLSDRTATQVLFAGASKEVTGDAGFTYSASDDQATLSQSHATTTPFLIGTQASTGDAAFRLALGASRSFAHGIDNSDSDSLKWSTAASGTAVLGTGDLMTLTTGGSLGIGTTGPDRKLDVLDASNPQLRLTKTDGSDYVDLQANAGFKLTVNGTEFMTVSTVGDWAGTASRSATDHEFLWKNSNATANSNSYIIIEQDSGYGAIQFLDTTSGSRWTFGQDSVTAVAGTIFRLAYGDGLGTSVVWETNSDGETVINDLSADRDTAFFTLVGSGNAFGTPTERTSIFFDISPTRAWPGAGSPTIAAQRDVWIAAGVYSLASGTAVTFTDAATFYIAGEPTGGAGITITNPWAIWVDSGACRFDGKTYHAGEVEIDGALNHDGTTVGFYAVTPVTRPSAYTQTYSTTTRTHANFTSNDLSAFTGGLIGFLDAAERDGVRTEFNALRADVANLKQLVNSMIDDRQADGLAQ